MNSWTIGEISGIKLRVHWTFLLLPVYIYYATRMAGSGVGAAVMSVVFVLAIFGCVLLHELGHALAARQFGIPTRDITLLPIGGVAALERMPRNPFQELWIAIAGPLVNVVIATLLFLGYAAGLLGVSPQESFWYQLAWANVALVVFNMIPAFPMDGGRVLRSVLAMFTDWVQATSIAVSVGKFAAVAFGLLGLLSGNLMLVFVAGFVFLAAHSELVAATATRGWTANQPVDQRVASFRPAEWDMETLPFELHEETVPSSLTTSSVAAWLANRKTDYCRVVESGRTIGTVTKNQLLAALARGLGHLPVGQLVR